jgi:hypothetical protein
VVVDQTVVLRTRVRIRHLPSLRLTVIFGWLPTKMILGCPQDQKTRKGLGQKNIHLHIQCICIVNSIQYMSNTSRFLAIHLTKTTCLLLKIDIMKKNLNTKNYFISQIIDNIYVVEIKHVKSGWSTHPF